MTPRIRECAACDNEVCKCRTCRGTDPELVIQCKCAFSEDTACSWPSTKLLFRSTEEDIV